LAKTTPEEDEQIKTLEKRLTIFNLIRVRKQVNLNKEKVAKNTSWFSSWFSTTTINDDKGFLQDLTPEEKRSLERLLKTKQLRYPKNYETLRLTLLLENLTLKLSCVNEIIMSLDMSNFRITYTQAGIGYRFDGELHSITALGCSNKKFISKLSQDEIIEHNLIEFKFENIGKIDKLRFRGEPLEIVYDPKTIQGLVDCFRIEQDVSIHLIKDKAMKKYKDFKETSKRKRLKDNRFEIDLLFDAPRLVLPDEGKVIKFSTLALKVVIDVDIRNPSFSDGNIATL
jgi:hypothetical protein